MIGDQHQIAGHERRIDRSGSVGHDRISIPSA
jgi:hypothetical protein